MNVAVPTAMATGSLLQKRVLRARRRNLQVRTPACDRARHSSHTLSVLCAYTPDIIHYISDVLINMAFRRQQQTCDYREFEKRWRRARRPKCVLCLPTACGLSSE